ncbi:hypothetical protein AAVH_06797 [Aphelenchoides avenae]|nr:hypothetical protein AAVH_06797 [Aphelenchus avenae]
METSRYRRKNYESFNEQFRGVRCHLWNDETLSVVIQGVTEKPIGDLREVNDDGEESRYSSADIFRGRFLDLMDDRQAVRVSNHFPNDFIS